VIAAVLSTLVLLHMQAGFSSWVNPSEVSYVTDLAAGLCVYGTNTRLRMSDGSNICVIETPQEVINKLEKAK
jgi:hypothetical protein